MADRSHLAGEGGDGVAVGIELGLAQQLEDALLHAFRDHVLEALGLVMHLVPGVAQDADQEHLEEAVVTNELEGNLAALARELLAAVPVVLHQALGREPGDHLADTRR